MNSYLIDIRYKSASSKLNLRHKLIQKCVRFTRSIFWYVRNTINLLSTGLEKDAKKKNLFKTKADLITLAKIDKAKS